MTAVEFLDRLDVDIERIEEQPAVRRVRTAGRAGPVIELRVQRIESDARAAKVGNDFQQVGEIAEIAVAPVAPRAHAIELHRQDPAFPPVALIGGCGLSRWFTPGSRLIAARGQRLDDPADRALVGVPATALDIEIARLDAPARRQFGQIHRNFTPE